MRKCALIVIIFILLLLSCNRKSNNQKGMSKESVMQIEEKEFDFLKKISNVPITPLPIGVECLDSIKELDYNDFGMRNIPVSYEIDTNDRFKLNKFLNNSLSLYEYDSNLNSLNMSITPVDSATIYFSKRLPPKGNKNFLLCKIIQYKNVKEEPFTGWILLTIADQYASNWLQIAQSLTSEETYRYALFHIDKEYNIVVNAYSTSYYNRSSIAHLYGRQYYSLSEEDNNISFDFEEYVEIENSSAGEHE